MPLYHAEDGSRRNGCILARQKEKKLRSLMLSHRSPSAPLPMCWMSYLGAPQSCSISRAMSERRQDSPPHLLVLFALTRDMHCSLDLKASKIKLNRTTFSSYACILMPVQFALCGNLSTEINQHFNMKCILIRQILF